MKKVAVLWDERYLPETGFPKDGSRPFYDDGINDSMEFMATEGRKMGVEIYVAHFSSYENKGLITAFYFEDGWKTEKDIKIDLVFDKFYFNDETKKLKYRIGEDIGIFNRPEFEELCKDKLSVYSLFHKRVPRTIKATEEDLDSGLSEIDSERVVLKPRFGSGGELVKVVEKSAVEEELNEFDTEDLRKGKVLVQEFKDSSNGVPFLEVNGVHDLRVILVDGEISYSFVRMPKSGCISNVSRGGSMDFVSTEKLPEELVEIIEEIDYRLRENEKRVYSTDFLYDEEGRPWLIELNSKPGIKFGDERVTEAKKKFIRDILAILGS